MGDYRCIVNRIGKWGHKSTTKCSFDWRKRNIIKTKKSKKVITMYKINKEIIMFGDTEVEIHKVQQNKNTILMCDVDIHKIVVSSKFPFSKKGFKCFLGYEETRKIRLLCIILPKMSTYGRDFDETKYMFFFY